MNETDFSSVLRTTADDFGSVSGTTESPSCSGQSPTAIRQSSGQSPTAETMTEKPKRVVQVSDIAASVGSEVGCSEWRIVSQEMIDRFADATDDHQFIHVDREKAAQTPFGTTIAHGFLTLSLLSTLAYEALPTLEGQTLGINYGFDKVRFMTPVKSGQRVRAHFTLSNADIRPSGRIVLHYAVVLEIEALKKPALTADWITIAMVPPAA